MKKTTLVLLLLFSALGTMLAQRTISGTVKVRFIIEKNGKASNFNVVQTTAGGCNEETIRLLKAVRCEPGMINNKPVRVRSEYSLSFVHPGNTYR